MKKLEINVLGFLDTWTHNSEWAKRLAILLLIMF